jgi:hypothetical protein
MSGKTINGVDASGGIVIVYYMDKTGPIFLLGQETIYLSESPHVKHFKSSAGENIHDAFLFPGTINNKIDIDKAKHKFTEICKELETFNPRFIKHVTFSDIEASSKKGFISAKPRYVGRYEPKSSRFDFKKKHDESISIDRFGFPKGGYISGKDYIKIRNNSMNIEDFSINDTVIRECYEETSIKLDNSKLQDMNKLFSSGGHSQYALFIYELSDLEFDSIHKLNLLGLKNKMYENELHNIQFLRIPDKEHRRFFINAISREVYEYFKENVLHIKFAQGGTRLKLKPTQKKTLKSKIYRNKSALKLSLRKRH